MQPPIDVRLVDEPVAIETNDADAHTILARCYRDAGDAGERATAPATVPATVLDRARLHARLRRGEDSDAFTIDVEGRETVRATGITSAVRTFNHELAHGVMLRSRDHFFVHAGVVSVGGRGIVLPGLSRAGKSTLVLALLERGAAFLSDELLAFDPAARVARAFPRALKIRDESYDYFPSVAAAMVGEGEGRFLPASVAFALADRVPVDLIVAPQWDPAGDDRLRATSRGETLLSLTASALNIGSHGGGASMGHLSALVASAPGYAVAWRDPHAAAAGILAALAGSD